MYHLDLSGHMPAIPAQKNISMIAERAGDLRGSDSPLLVSQSSR